MHEAHHETKGAIRLRRVAVRVFVLLVLASMVVETSPSVFKWPRVLKSWCAPALRFSGLWQGEWPLFAPNPVLNNAWITAEVYAPDGTLTIWNSPYWAETSSVGKLRNFRYINLYNRLPFRGKEPADDFADYIARQMIDPHVQPYEPPETESLQPAVAGVASYAGRWQLRLLRSQLNIILPEDGSLPSREETMWVTSNTPLTIREYLP